MQVNELVGINVFIIIIAWAMCVQVHNAKNINEIHACTINSMHMCFILHALTMVNRIPEQVQAKKVYPHVQYIFS